MRPPSATAVLASPAVGARLRRRRGELRLTQGQVAERVGVTKRAYQAWERGESGITAENLDRLAVAFDVSDDWIGSSLEELPAGDAEALLDDIHQAVIDPASGSVAFLASTLRDIQERLARIEEVLAGHAVGPGDEAAVREIEEAAAEATALLASEHEETPSAPRVPAHRQAAS